MASYERLGVTQHFSRMHEQGVWGVFQKGWQGLKSHAEYNTHLHMPYIRTVALLPRTPEMRFDARHHGCCRQHSLDDFVPGVLEILTIVREIWQSIDAVDANVHLLGQQCVHLRIEQPVLSTV